MKFARSLRRAMFAVAGLAAAYGAPAFAADDKSTIGSVMELVGVSSDPSAAKIDYSERPKLVLPPRAGDLPAPRENADRPGGWPVDAAAARRRNTDRYAKVHGAEPEEGKPGLLERALSGGSASNAPVMDEPGRRMLSDPPSGYRRPTKDLSSIADPDAKKGAWWNPMTYINGDAPPAKGAPGQQQAQSEHHWYLPFISKEVGKE
jgi:hypothetical protein